MSRSWRDKNSGNPEQKYQTHLFGQDKYICTFQFSFYALYFENTSHFVKYEMINLIE